MIKLVPQARPCDTESSADFHRYYRLAYVGWYKHPAGPQPVVVHAAAGNAVVVQDLQGRAHEISWDRARKEMSFGTPDLGMVNGEGTIIYLYRSSPREPHRGYRPGGTNYRLFNGWGLREVEALNPGNPSVVQRLFFPEYYEFKEALQELKNGNRVGCALSKYLGLYTTSTSKYPNIAYRRNTIGYLEDETRAVVPRMFLDALPQIKEKLGVEVVVK